MIRVQRVASVYQALVFAMFVVTLPFGLMVVLKFANGAVGNTNPRKGTEVLAATNPMFARLAVSQILLVYLCEPYPGAECREEPVRKLPFLRRGCPWCYSGAHSQNCVTV